MVLLGEYLLIENNDGAFSNELELWHTQHSSIFSDVFARKVGPIVESGIYAYNCHYEELVSQLNVLKDFVAISRFNYSWSLFSLVNQMTSKYTPLALYSSGSYRVSQSLISTNEGWVSAGTMHDFRYVWIFYGILVMVLICALFSEYVWCHINKKGTQVR